MLYKLEDYEINIFPSEDEDGYVATTLELPTISGCADTPEQALKELVEVFELTRQTFEEDNEDMPQPLSKKKYSGQFRLRIPKHLHYELVKAAILQDISLNQLAVYLLSKGVNLLRK